MSAGNIVRRRLPPGGEVGEYIQLNAQKKPSWGAGSTIAGHKASHQHGGSDEIATATPAANVIPKAGAGGTLAAGFLPQATSAAIGGALLGASGGAPKLTKMPDGATAVFYEDTFAAGHGWTSDGAMDMSVVSNALRMTRKATGGTGAGGLIRIISGIPGKTVWIKYRYSSLSAADMAPVTVCGYVGGYFDVLGTLAPSLSYAVVPLQVPLAGVSLNGLYFRSASGLASAWFEVKAVWIGDYSYLTGTLSEEAARIADQLGDSAGVGVAASGTITATDQPTAGKGDTIGGKKYTYVAALTASPGVEGEVLIGSDKEDTLENLDLAMSETARTNNGTKYWAAAVHPLVSSAHTVGAASITLTAKNTGELGNAITLSCESGTNHTASGTTLTGGYSDAAAKIINATKNNIAGGMTRPAAAQVELTNNALIGYETTVDVAKDATFTLPAGGTWIWNVYGYGATISSAKRGSSAGGTTLTVAGANASVGYRRVA